MINVFIALGAIILALVVLLWCVRSQAAPSKPSKKSRLVLHCMVDLETLSLASNAYIRSVGAAFFNASGVTTSFYESCDGYDQPGADIDDATRVWWEQQSDEAKAALANPWQNRLIDTLESFNRWVNEEVRHAEGMDPLKREAEVWIWSNGADFDAVILTNAYKRLALAFPWMWYNVRCYRTLKNLPSLRHIRPREFEGAKHSALADARHQAEHASRLLRALH